MDFRKGSLLTLLVACIATLVPESALADSAAEMARKLQNPLANIKALMTDNAIGFDTGTTGDTSYAFQLQPVYAIDMPDRGFTLIPRANIPILGLEPGTDTPRTGQPGTGTGSTWGLGDSVVQAFYAPYTDGKWKWGIGPQISLPTATDSALEGPGWGAGVAGVITGELTQEISFAGLIANHWGDNGNFNTMTIQPMLYYNVPGRPGESLSYNAVISADWEAGSSNRWTVPLGLSYSKTIDLGDGHGLDFGGGPYYNVVRPDGAARWQIRFSVSWLLP
jgi:hypothetical protein